VPLSTLLTMYKSLILPYITYGFPVWGQTSKSNLNKILVLQKRALRLMYISPIREHAIPLFSSSHTLPVQLLYFLSISTLMHDIKNNKVPSNISNMFTPLTSIHCHNTRAALKENVYVKSCRTKTLSKSFSRIGSKVWNAIPESIRSCSKKKILLNHN
jgi:hypothetical protein